LLRRIFSGIMLTFLIGMLAWSFKIQPSFGTWMGETIYIKADGSVSPPNAPISSIDNVTYTFTGNIYDEIVVQRDNIVIDGAGYTLQGTGSGRGIDLTDRRGIKSRTWKSRLSPTVSISMDIQNITT